MLGREPRGAATLATLAICALAEHSNGHLHPSLFFAPAAPLFISFGRHSGYRYSVRDVDHGFSRDYRYGYPLTFVRNKRNNLVVYFFVLRVVPVLF